MDEINRLEDGKMKRRRRMSQMKNRIERRDKQEKKTKGEWIRQME